MFETLQNFEQSAGRLSPIVLIGPGLAAVLIGLFVWLGGLGLRRVLAIVLGAIVGWICGFFIVGRNVMAATVSALAGALVGTVLYKVVITIITVFLAAALGFAVVHLVETDFGVSQETNTAYQSRKPVEGPTLSVGESAQLMKAYAINFGDEIKQACSKMPLYNWAIIAVLVVISIVAGFYLQRLTSALSCAALGTLLIFAGMILLLFYKGSVPIGIIYNKPLFYAAVFGVMVAFGTIVQLLLGPRLESRRKKAAQEEPARRKHRWRTS